MRFDIIVGNPPFSIPTPDNKKSTDLDSLFIEASLRLGRSVAMIIRSKHFTYAHSRFRRELFASGHVYRLSHVDKSHFPTILNTQTCVVYADSAHHDTAQIDFVDGSDQQVSLTPDTIIMLTKPGYRGEVSDNLAHRWMVGGVPRHAINDDPTGIPIVEIMGSRTSPEPIVRRISRDHKTTGRGLHGVIMNLNVSWGSLGKMAVKPVDAAITGSVVCLQTDDDDQARQLIDYLQSERVRQTVAASMAGFSANRALFRCIPDPFISSLPAHVDK